MQAVQAKMARIAIKNILFATDFSPAANAAAPYATQLARNYDAKVFGVHINPFENYAVAASEAWAAMSDSAEERAKEDSARLNKQLAGVQHEVVIGEGNIWETLNELIQHKGIDLIVLGTHGRSGMGRILLGSVAEEILRQAPCPVLTVGPHVITDPDKAAAMKEILYATDLATDIPTASPYAVSLAQENRRGWRSSMSSTHARLPRSRFRASLQTPSLRRFTSSSPRMRNSGASRGTSSSKASRPTRFSRAQRRWTPTSSYSARSQQHG